MINIKIIDVSDDVHTGSGVKTELINTIFDFNLQL